MSSPDHSLAQSSHRNATDRNTNSLPSLKTLTNKTEPISYNPTSRSSTNQYSNQFGLTSSDSSPSSSSAHTPRSNTSGSNARYGHHQNFSTSSSTSFTSTSNKPDKIIFQSSPTTLLSKNMSSHSQNEKAASSTAMNGRKRKSSQEAIGFSRSPSSGLQHNRGGSNVTLSDGERSSPAVNNGTLVRSASDSQQGKSNHSKSNSLNAQQQQSTKRIKTARACDSCRRKKIRCDVIDDGGPILGDPNNGNGGLTCAHCRQYGFECTFFLPITETRFKKKREREAEEIAAAAAAAAAGRSHLGVGVGNGGAGGGGILPPLMHHPSRAMPLSAMPFGDPSFVPSGHPIAMPIRSTSNPSIPFNNKLKLDGPPVRISSTQEWPKPDSQGNSPSVRGNSRNHHQISRDTSLSSMRWGQQTQQSTIKSRQSSADDTPPPPDTRVLGPTSLAYIVHSTAFVPGAAIEEHDLKHHQTFEVGASGDGIIKFHKPPRGAITEADESDDLAEDLVRVPESLRGRLAGDVAEKLVNTYFEKLGFLFPVVTKSEFLHMSPPPPLMLYGICGITALSREVPKEVLSAIKATLHSMFRNVDIMSNSNINNVKSLLIMSLHSDIHGSTAVQSGSRYWNRVGAAVRMAQDLGLHRDASKRDDLDDDAFFLEQKRRVWGCCVTADRIVSITCGHPLTIDLTDCDVRLPSPHEILRYPTDLPAVPGVDKPFAFNTEMLKLSILFGRVMKTIYSPTGLMKTTDEEIMGLLNDIDRWKENLPVALQFRGAKESPAPAGILHVSFSCLLHLFFRVFMRISYNCPQHLTFSLTIERMTTVIKNTREAIAWVDLNDFYLDTIQLVSYGLVFCTTVQYHAWIRRGDQEAMASIQKAHDCVMRFERQGEHDSNQDLSMRAKTAGVINLLHKSAIGTYKNTPNSGNLNPTAGVSNRRWMDTVRGIVFKPDQSKPGGGVYIATNHNLMLDDVPPGTMILQETEAGAVPALVRTNTDNKGSVWRAVGNMATVMSGDSNNSQMSNQHSMNASGPGNNGDITRDFTHVAGGVWADAQGRPVDSQGSRLLTMIPVPGGEAIIQSYPGGPRLSFSSIAGGIAPPTGMNGNATGSTGENSTTTNSSIAFTDPAWLSALAAQAAAQSSNGNQNNNNNNVNQESQTNQNNGETLPPTFNFSDLYTFDGQIAQPAAMLPPDQAEQARTGILNVSQTSQAPSIYTFGNASGENFSNINNVTQSDVTTSNGGISNSQSHSVDPLSLDGMPGGLDFAAWEQWFRGTNTANVGTDGNQNNNNNSNSRTN